MTIDDFEFLLKYAKTGMKEKRRVRKMGRNFQSDRSIAKDGSREIWLLVNTCVVYGVARWERFLTIIVF